MLGLQLHLEDLFLLRRQVGGHLFLGAAQHQRADPPAELRQTLCVAFLLDRACGRPRVKRGRDWGTARAAIANSDHSSMRLFSMGVPVIASLKACGQLPWRTRGPWLVVLHELRLVQDQAGTTTPAEYAS